LLSKSSLELIDCRDGRAERDADELAVYPHEMKEEQIRQGKSLRKQSRASVDAAMIAAAIAPLAARWSGQSALRPVSAASMRGIRAKAVRLGLTPELVAARAGEAVAAVARAIADARDPERRLPIFLLAGSDRDAVYGLEAALALADGSRRIVVGLSGTKARPEHSSASGAWDRLESASRVERYRIPNMREAAHFRAGLDEVALLIEALSGAPSSVAPQTPLLAAIDLLRRARTAGVPCLAINGPIGLDPESGARRRGAPGADVSILFHRPLITHQSAASKRLLGEVLVAPIGIPAEADALAV
jgi:NAD(P)H-hydrate epimerase